MKICCVLANLDWVVAVNFDSIKGIISLSYGWIIFGRPLEILCFPNLFDYNYGVRKSVLVVLFIDLNVSLSFNDCNTLDVPDLNYLKVDDLVCPN